MSKFYKYQATGNDFILIEDFSEEFLPRFRHLVRSLCRFHYGIGADGLLLLQTSKVADVNMRIFNSDGSEAKMCGNGVRCVARHIGHSCSIETGAGICFTELQGESIRASLPPSKIVELSIDLPRDLQGHLVYTGTHHLVIFVPDLNLPDFLPLASLYRHHERFQPQGVNVNFACVMQDNQITARTFEKGVERETFSCGSGGAAIFLAYLALYQPKQKEIKIVSIQREEISFCLDEQGTIWMSGPAELSFTGEFLLSSADESSRRLGV